MIKNEWLKKILTYLPRATKRHYVVKKPIVINVMEPMHEIHVNFK